MAGKIQVLQVSADNFKKGGMSQVIWRLMENLSDEVQFSFLTYRDDVSDEVLAELASYGAKRVCLKEAVSNKYVKFVTRYYQAVKVLKAGKFDFIHINADNIIGAAVYILAGIRCGCRIIVHCHTTRFPTNNKPLIKIKTTICRILYKLLKDHIDIKLAVSTPAAKFFYGSDISDVHILLNGLASERYVYNEDKRRILRQKMCAEDKFIVGHIGRFCYAKNHGFLLDVFGDAARKNEVLELWLIGNGPLEDEVRQKAENMGLGSKVRFMGTTQDIQMYLSAFDIFIFPSRYEGFPLAFVEAQTSGLPVIVSDAVTDEAEFSDKVCRLPLNASIEEWSNALLGNISCGSRRDMTEDINNAGLSIYEVSKKYRDLLRQKLR